MNVNDGFDNKELDINALPPEVTLGSYDPVLMSQVEKYYQTYNRYIKKCGLTGRDIERFEIKTPFILRKIKVGLILRFPKLMIEIIQILLFREEVHLACYLTAFYEIEVDAQQII